MSGFWREVGKWLLDPAGVVRAEQAKNALIARLREENARLQVENDSLDEETDELFQDLRDIAEALGVEIVTTPRILEEVRRLQSRYRGARYLD